MNEEIKEILENIKKCCEIQKDNSFVVYQKQDIEKTLNYITNLQEENQKLKKLIITLQKNIIELKCNDEELKLLNNILGDENE